MRRAGRANTARRQWRACVEQSAAAGAPVTAGGGVWEHSGPVARRTQANHNCCYGSSRR